MPADILGAGVGPEPVPGIVRRWPTRTNDGLAIPFAAAMAEMVDP
jgi:hypothetical protein